MSSDFNNGQDFQKELSLLPIRELVVFPYMIIPLFVGRESSIKAVEQAIHHQGRMIFLASQKETQLETPSPQDIYQTGVVAMIMRMRKLPDGRIKILVQGLTKARVSSFDQSAPYFKVKLDKVQDSSFEESNENQALMIEVRRLIEKSISLGKELSSDLLLILEDVSDPGRLANLVASNIGLPYREAQSLLEELSAVAMIQAKQDSDNLN